MEVTHLIVSASMATDPNGTSTAANAAAWSSLVAADAFFEERAAGVASGGLLGMTSP